MSAAGRRLRLGLIGCGRIAELGYAPAIAGLEGVTVTALADPEAERLVRVAGLIEAPTAPRTFATAAEVVGSGAVDAVIIASPAAEHVWQAELAARASIPALVEKPPAPTLAGAERVAALSPPPWIGFNRRFQHAARVAAAIPADGRLELELEIGYRRASWRPLTPGDDALLDLGPHLVDLALVLGGSPSARVRSAKLAPEQAELELELERGRARIRCATNRPHRELVAVRDPSGRRLARSTAGGPLAMVSGRLPGRVHPLVGSLRRQVAAFASAARGGDPGSLASAADGVRVMRVIDEARRVAANGRQSR